MQIDQILGDVVKMRESSNVPCLFEKFILEFGLNASGLPFDGPQGVPGQCFQNALNMSLSRCVNYVEGFALRPWVGVPVHHAWCEFDDHTVIDPTWSKPEDCQYLGVSFKHTDALERVIETRIYGLFYIPHLDVDFVRKVAIRVCKGR